MRKLQTIPKESGISVKLSCLFAALVLLSPALGAADIFTWQDAEGVIHFSNGDAPPEARLYMEEPVDAHPTPRMGASAEAAEEREHLESLNESLREQLEEAGQKLSTALEKVDDLTQKAEDAHYRADQAAQTAWQAAADAARASSDYDYPLEERVVVFGAPYLPQHSLHKRHPDKLKHDANKPDGINSPIADFGKLRDENHPLSRGPSGFEKKFIRRENSLSNVQQLINGTRSKPGAMPDRDRREKDGDDRRKDRRPERPLS